MHSTFSQPASEQEMGGISLGSSGNKCKAPSERHLNGRLYLLAKSFNGVCSKEKGSTCSFCVLSRAFSAARDPSCFLSDRSCSLSLTDLALDLIDIALSLIDLAFYLIDLPLSLIGLGLVLIDLALSLFDPSCSWFDRSCSFFGSVPGVRCCGLSWLLMSAMHAPNHELSGLVSILTAYLDPSRFNFTCVTWLCFQQSPVNLIHATLKWML